MSWGTKILIAFAVLTILGSLAISAMFVREMHKDGKLTPLTFIVALFWFPVGVWLAVVEGERP
jgi:membrane protein insertase Oxa1/YidC/SpoIIIJ